MQLTSLVGGYVEAAEADLSLRLAARTMATKNIGSLLVAPDGRIHGIITERDLVRAASQGADFDTEIVGDWMADYPQLAQADWDVRRAVDEMLHQGFRHMPVVEGDRPVGMVSIKDLVWAMRAVET